MTFSLCEQIPLAEVHILCFDSNKNYFLFKNTVFLTSKNQVLTYIITNHLPVLQRLFAGLEQVKIYHHHLFYHNLFVLIYTSFSNKAVESCGNKNLGIFVLNVEDYLINFYPEVQSVLELYYSLATVHAELKESGSYFEEIDPLFATPKTLN